jgi:Protein of unknown function (DUF3224).
MMHASGSFDVSMTAQPADADAGDPGIGRMALVKQFHGDLEASSRGQMLAMRTEVAGSAGYVALERVDGSLHGRTGTFALQHSGTMTRGEPELRITVVPDSGTGALQGLTGTLTITMAEGRHDYELAYTLPEAV